MSEREYKRVTRQLKPFITLFIVVVGSAFLASCGGGSGSSDPTATLSSTEEPNATAQAVTVSGGTVPGAWKGRVPLPSLQPTKKYGVINEESLSYAKGILVVYQNPNNTKAIQEYISKKQWRIIGQEGNIIQIYTAALTQADLRLAEKDVENSGLFDLVTLDYIGSNNEFTNPDPSLNDPIKYWNYGAINVVPAWDNVSKQTDLRRVRVGLPDSEFTKVKVGSLTLKSVVTSLNESDCDVSPLDKCDSHGYHVGGIIGATGNDGNDHVGIGSGSTNLTDIYAADATSISTFVGYTASFVNLNNRIINYSRGITRFAAGTTSISKDGYTAAVSAAQTSAKLLNLALIDLSKERVAAGKDMDVLFVQASGNDGRIAIAGETFKVGSEENGLFNSFLKYSSASQIYSIIASQTLIVGSFTRSRSVSEFTSLPNTPELEARFILAPGSEIYSDTRTGLQAKSGTSMAAPHVVGVASLLLQVNSSLSSREVADIILKTADNEAGTLWKDGDKYRYLNAEAAVKEAIRRKVEVNCGSVTSPGVVGQQGPSYTVTAGQATRFNTTPVPNNGYPFGTYRWKTSEGAEILSTIEQANVTFTAAGAGSVTVTPVLADGTVCTGHAATSSVTVTGAPLTILRDDFNGTSVDTTKWNIDGWDVSHIGPVSVAGGLAQFGAWGRISTKNKVTFSGQRIVIEARMAGQGGSRDTSILFADAESGEYIYSGDTNYSGWGFFVDATGAYRLLDAGSGPAALGGSTNQFMEYRWTLEGNKITIERGPTLANITQSATRTLGRSISGRSFYLSIGTASPNYSPGTWDWVRAYTGSGTLNPANSHRYEVITCGTWPQCRDAAVAKGGKLVTIRNQAENDWLAANFSMTALYWIGAYYDTQARTWKWASGEPFVYSHWGDNLNNSGGDEYCSHFFPPTPGFWNDVRCGYEYSTKAIVEYLN